MKINEVSNVHAQNMLLLNKSHCGIATDNRALSKELRQRKGM